MGGLSFSGSAAALRARLARFLSMPACASVVGEASGFSLTRCLPCWFAERRLSEMREQQPKAKRQGKAATNVAEIKALGEPDQFQPALLCSPTM